MRLDSRTLPLLLLLALLFLTGGPANAAITWEFRIEPTGQPGEIGLPHNSMLRVRFDPTSPTSIFGGGPISNAAIGWVTDDMHAVLPTLGSFHPASGVDSGINFTQLLPSSAGGAVLERLDVVMQLADLPFTSYVYVWMMSDWGLGNRHMSTFGSLTAPTPLGDIAPSDIFFNYAALVIAGQNTVSGRVVEWRAIPVSEPSAISLLVLVSVGLLASRSRRR